MPQIVTARPMTDLCWTCQRNNQLIYRSANLHECDKSNRVKEQQDHLQLVQQEVCVLVRVPTDGEKKFIMCLPVM